jgi:alkylation response protein AidB-like acyl-CoA dehydrogenase
VPKRFGGDQLDDVVTVRIIEERSRLDGSVGWNVMIATGNAVAAACLSEVAAQDIFGANASTVIAGSLRPFPGNTATPVDGGYRVNGRWTVASGCHQAGWMAGACFVVGNGDSRSNGESAPDLRIMFWQRSECEILDTWCTSGMRGTGSHDFQTFNAIVPGARSVVMRANGPNEPGVLSLRNAFARAAPLVAAVGLGVARAAIDSLVELAI